MGKRLCKTCKVTELGYRERVCLKCLVRQPRRSSNSAVVLSSPNKDVVLACGHVVASSEPVGALRRCPLHRKQYLIVRLHDGVEVPAVVPRERSA